MTGPATAIAADAAPARDTTRVDGGQRIPLVRATAWW
jgi:hypothetical protein